MLKEAVGFQINKTIPEQIVSLIKKELDEQTKTESLIPVSTDGTQNPSPSKVNSRNKRPYRLIPVNKVDDFNSDSFDKAISKFYGPPTNCSDLSRLGYTLNGFYLVKAVENSGSLVKDGSNRNVMQVEAVSCMFKHPNDIYDANNDVKENRAVLNVKYERKSPSNEASVGVHFQFRTKSTLDTSILSDITFDIKFDDIVLNVGGGLYNKSKGAFVVPKTGIYQFAFSGLVLSNMASIGNPTIIRLRVHRRSLDEFIRIVDNHLLNQVLLATIKLQRGDSISVQIVILDKGFSIVRKFFQLHSLATFSGSLLEETD